MAILNRDLQYIHAKDRLTREFGDTMGGKLVGSQHFA